MSELLALATARAQNDELSANLAESRREAENLRARLETARAHLAASQDGNATLRARLAEAERERESLSGNYNIVSGSLDYVSNLLAIIHRDGGHYAAQHGLAKATDDAIAKWHEMKSERDALRAVVDGWTQYDNADPQVKGECLREARDRTAALAAKGGA